MLLELVHSFSMCVYLPIDGPRTDSSQATSSSAQTLEHKPIVGDYTFRGCYTEGDGVRAVTDAGVTIASYDYADMTVEECASNCAGYKYWGVEYSGECYCGNTLAATSILAPLSDCSFICPGDSDEYCGAGNRLELYELSADIPSVVSLAIASSAIASSAIASSAIASSSSVLAPTQLHWLLLRGHKRPYLFRRNLY